MATDSAEQQTRVLERMRARELEVFVDALRHGDAAAVQHAIDLGIPFQHVPPSGIPSLQFCEDREKDVNLIKLLMSYRVSPNDKNPANGYNALHWAVSLGATTNSATSEKDKEDPFQSARIELLLEKNADPTAVNDIGYTPVQLAASVGNVAALDVFYCRNIEIAHDTLHLACRGGHIAAAKYLLCQVGTRGGRKFTANAPNVERGGVTPLQVSASVGHTHLVRFLIEEHNGDISATDDRGRTALHYAADGKDGNDGVLKYLLSVAKADPNTADIAGRTPLACALRDGRKRNAQILLGVEQRGANSSTPILWRQFVAGAS